MIDNPLNRLDVKRGADLPHAKLTEAQATEIVEAIDLRNRLRERAATMTNKRLAEKYGVHYRTIDKISAGESWTHITV